MSSRYILPFADIGSGIKPSSGAKLEFFKTDGVTPKDTFSDQLSTPTPNTNPVIADSNGVFADIFIEGNYKHTLKDKDDVQIFGGVTISSIGALGDNVGVFTLADAVANTGAVEGQIVFIKERNALFEYKTGQTPNTFDIVAADAVGLDLALRVDQYQYLEFRMFGAEPSPADNTGVFDRIIAASGETGKLIDWGQGEFSTSTPHDASACVGMLSTGKAKITATYEQVDGAGITVNSLFLVDGKDEFSAKDFEIEYTGTFDKGLVGQVCGIYIINSDNVVVENIHGHDFNQSAVAVGLEGADCFKPRIENNRFIHNRLAGQFLGNSDMALITKNFYRENGLIGDNTTGYGLAVLAGTSAKNITVTHNRTFKNVRRGLDLHSHQTALVTGNICFKDIIGGIFAVTRGNASRSITVTDNIVFCDDQSVNVELGYTAIQIGVSGIIPTSGQVPTIIEGNNQMFNLSKDFGVTGISAINVTGLSFVGGLVDTQSMQILSASSTLRGVDFAPIVCTFTNGDTVDVKINNHTIVGGDLERLVNFAGEGNNLGRREVTGLDVRADSVVGDNITTTGGFSSIRFEDNYLNGIPLDSVIFTSLGYEKTYIRTVSLLAGVPKLVFDSLVKGEIATVDMTYNINSESVVALDIASGHGIILAGWSNTPNANINPIYTELVNASRKSTSGGSGVSDLNPVVTVQRNETGGNLRALEVLLTTDVDSTAFIKFEAIGPILTLTV